MIFFFLTQVSLGIIHGDEKYGFSLSTCGVCCEVVVYMMLICEVCGLIARRPAIRKVFNISFS